MDYSCFLTLWWPHDEVSPHHWVLICCVFIRWHEIFVTTAWCHSWCAGWWGTLEQHKLYIGSIIDGDRYFYQSLRPLTRPLQKSQSRWWRGGICGRYIYISWWHLPLLPLNTRAWRQTIQIIMFLVISNDPVCSGGGAAAAAAFTVTLSQWGHETETEPPPESWF